MKRTLSLIAVLVFLAGALALYGSAIAAAEPKADFGRAECDKQLADVCVMSIAVPQRNAGSDLATCVDGAEDAAVTDCSVRYLAGR